MLFTSDWTDDPPLFLHGMKSADTLCAFIRTGIGNKTKSHWSLILLFLSSSKLMPGTFHLLKKCYPRFTYAISQVSFHYFILYLEFEDFFSCGDINIWTFLMYFSLEVSLSDDWHSKLHLRLFSKVETEFCKSKSPLDFQGSQCRKALPRCLFRLPKKKFLLKVAFLMSLFLIFAILAMDWPQEVNLLWLILVSE